MRFALRASFQGSKFDGTAVQPGRRTVQTILQEALAKIDPIKPNCTPASRLDAGVSLFVHMSC